MSYKSYNYFPRYWNGNRWDCLHNKTATPLCICFEYVHTCPEHIRKPMDWNIPSFEASASLTSKLLSTTFSFKHQSPCIGTSFPKKFRKSSETWTWKKTDCWNMRCDFFERLTSKFYPRFPSKKQPPSLRVFCDLTGPTVIPSYLAPPFTTPPNRRGRQAPTPEALPRSVPWRRDGRDELLECPPFFRPTKLWSKGT